MRWEGGVTETVGSRQESGFGYDVIQYDFSSRYDRTLWQNRSSHKLTLIVPPRLIGVVESF
jgi:hypothetical protein